MEDTNAFWDANIFNIIAIFPLNQVLLKDMDEPIKAVRPWVTSQVRWSNAGIIDWKYVEMALNEFTSKEDYIGMFESEPEP